ncbi:MAG: 23S rRNA (uracil(1939)-C(5))-methyltransferase RlmD [Candidatus Baltobacteraceae bacterium]
MTSRDTAPKKTAALRRGAEIDVAFNDLLANGQGVGRAEGMVVFCFGPLPHERARVRITTVKQRYAVADLIELLEVSPERARPFCPVFGTCGGCQLQHLGYDAQLAWKRDAVAGALTRIGGLRDVEVAPAIGMDEPRAYRNKMSLVVDQALTPPAIGFYKQRSHDVVPIDACPVVTPPLGAALAALYAHRANPAFGDARHLVARSSRANEQLVLTITTAQPSEHAAQIAPRLMQEIPGLVGLTNSFDLSSENAILGRHHRRLAGEDQIEEAIGGVRYRVSAGSFFQVNAEMVARIFEYLRPYLTQSQKIVDLYCGTGTFALYFAKEGCSVYGIEESPLAIGEATANAQLNGLAERARFQAGRVEEIASAPELRNELRAADVVFLDPPRKGCDEVTLGAIADAAVPALWYLSCDPATLARDLKFLVAKGYRLLGVQPFDMFPQTGHIEIFVRLEYSERVVGPN